MTESTNSESKLIVLLLLPLVLLFALLSDILGLEFGANNSGH